MLSLIACCNSSSCAWCKQRHSGPRKVVNLSVYNLQCSAFFHLCLS